MARLKSNPLVNGFSGGLGDIVFKNYRYGTVISKRPNMSKVKRTRQQKENNSRFKKAVAYARGVVVNAALKKAYEKKSKITGRSVYHLAISDFMADPTKHNGI
jgi:hypothetical protein